MSEMSSKLEQVLEYLVNGEQDKAEALLHDAIVEKARAIHEELVNEDTSTADEKVEETSEEKVEEATDSEEAVEESKEEESTTESKEEAVEETVGGETGDAEQDLKDELKQEAEDNAEEIEYEETNEGDDDEEGEEKADHEETEERVDDLEDALEELKDKFEKIMAGDDAEAEAPAEDEAEMEMPAEESVDAPIEEESKAETVEEASLTPVKTDNKDGSEKSKSPVANANMKDMGAAPSVSKGGDEKGAPAPKVEDMGATTEPSTSNVSVDSADGGDAKAKSTIAGK